MSNNGNLHIEKVFFAKNEMYLFWTEHLVPSFPKATSYK